MPDVGGPVTATASVRAGFVVGAGRNGMEYSALFLGCLAVVLLTNGVSYKIPGAARGGESAP